MLRSYLKKFSPRAWSNEQLRTVAQFVPPGARIINVAGWEDKDKEGSFYRNYFPSPALYHVSNYPGDQKRGANVHSDLLIDLGKPIDPTLVGKYDVVFNHTVLEHVKRPWFAFEQLCALSTDLVISVVPWKQKLHFEPGAFGDYFRISPLAMRMLHEENGLKVIYEAYTPLPALDVYLIHVGTKNPSRYEHLPFALQSESALNEQVGEFSARALIQNVGARFIQKYLS